MHEEHFYPFLYPNTNKVSLNLMKRVLKQSRVPIMSPTKEIRSNFEPDKCFIFRNSTFPSPLVFVLLFFTPSLGTLTADIIPYQFAWLIDCDYAKSRKIDCWESGGKNERKNSNRCFHFNWKTPALIAFS